MATDHEHANGVTAPADRPTPELMTAPELIAYLRLDSDDRDAIWRLRNLIRGHRLPVIRRGRLQLFRKSAIDAWLEAKPPNGRRTRRPARQSAVIQMQQQVTAKAD
jgi:hypothetical protein